MTKPKAYLQPKRQPRTGSMKARVLQMKLGGMEFEDIAKAMAHMHNKETIRSTIAHLRAEGHLPAAGSETFFRVTGPGLVAFAHHAEKRAINTSELAARILTTIAEDQSLINAVLDDGAE